ncbi:MAG: hypothetical protein FWB72_04280 [Firmicutes bacterium]|nr:hypothetical protein [Bacillota bacterium]
MEQLLTRLKDTYGYNEPIMTVEILEAWSDYSRPRVFQLLKKYSDEERLIKYDTGIYFFPTKTILGKLSTISKAQVLEKKYITNGNEIYGYFSGLSLLNLLGLTAQVPARPQIVSSKSSAIKRKVNYGKLTATIRKSKVSINKENVYALMLLEIFNILPQNKLTDSVVKVVRDFVNTFGIKQSDVLKYATIFPARAIKSLLQIGVENVFTQ